MRFQFLEFEFNSESFELLAHGRTVELPPKSLDVLSYLLRNRNRLVSKEELHQEIWGGKKIGVSTIPTAVGEIRRALRDTAKSPMAVQTVYGRGYRFIADVKESGDERDRPTRVERVETTGFIGRAEELGALARFLLGTGCEGAAFVSGRPGIGKSALLDELAARLRRRGVHAFLGRCLEVSGASPFSPWRDVIQQLRTANGKGCYHEGPLDQLLGETPSGQHLPFDSASAVRFDLFESIGRLFETAALTSPVVVMLDDIHQADEPSLLLLAYLIREARPKRVAFLGTLRPSGSGDRRRSAVIGQCLHDASMPAIELGPFSRLEAQRFVEVNSELRCSEDLVDRLYERTNGNPFFLSHLVRRLTASGVRTADDIQSRLQTLGQMTSDAIVAELGGLGGRAVALLEAAAVVGREFSILLVQEVEGASRESVLQDLETPMRDRVVEETGEPGILRFSHMIVRDAIYEAMGPPRKAQLHREVLAALEGVHRTISGEVACTAVRHALLCMERGDLPKLISYALEAARWSAQIYGFEEAIGYLGSAISASERYGGDPETRCELLLRLIIAERQSGDREAARDSCRRAADLARSTHSASCLGQIALSYAPGFFAIEAGVVDDFLIAALEEAQEELEGRDEEGLRARVLGRLAVALYWSDRDEDREAFANEAVRLAEGEDDPQLTADVLAAREVALWGPGDAKQRARIASWALAQARASDDREMELVCRLYRLTSLLQIGSFEEADKEVEVFSQRAEAGLQPGALWYRDLFGAFRAMMRGEWAAAEDLARSFVEQGRKVGDRNAENCGATHRAYRLLEYGDDREAFKIISRQADRYPRVRSFRCGSIFLGCVAGRVEQSRAEFRALADAGFGGIPRTVEWLIEMALLSEACVELREVGRARELYDLLLPHSDEYVVVLYSVAVWRPVSFYLGRLAGAAGIGSEAEEHFERAVSSSRDLGAWPWVAHCEFRFGEMLRERGRQGDRPRARQLVLRAEDTARRLKMRPLLRSIQTYLEDERRSGLV